MTRNASHSRDTLAGLIAARLIEQLSSLQTTWQTSGSIGHVVIDDLLPTDIANEIAGAFPALNELHFKSTIRERKAVSSQMNKHNPLIEEALFAFHDGRIVSLMERITNHTPLHSDPMLYAGGISRMEHEHFLNPHIDNSHNKTRTLWRSLNLLYYISPGWKEEFGGSLELWPQGMKAAPIVIESRFNRLVVMATHHESLHSVNPIRMHKARNCISNYYFSEVPMHPAQTPHLTSFRGRPEQPVRDLVLCIDTLLKKQLRRMKVDRLLQSKHWYRPNP